eukprot:2509664-Pyramimonas_sp.AAC.1
MCIRDRSNPLQDCDPAPLRIANGRFGHYVATAAMGIVRYAKLLHETRLRDEEAADEPSDGPADQE